MKYICEECKQPFEAPPSQEARFCSRACYDDSRRGTFECYNCGKTYTAYKSRKLRYKRGFCSRECHAEFIKKSPLNHPNWRGGSYRTIMEYVIGRKLKTSELIHHKNGDHKDNRFENLQIVTRAEHVRIHKPRRGKKFPVYSLT
jgi:hypothetical protein